MLTPKEIVEALDKYIIGQDKAKRAVAVALRNRYRRSLLDPDMREEITPKNIIMVGPTGVGKTEIARRLAKLVDAPFIKVEATKFTEVGYVGRDVDSMVRDLVDASLRLVKERKREIVRVSAEINTERRLVELLMPKQARKKQAQPNIMQLLLPSAENNNEEPETTETEKQERISKKHELLNNLRNGSLEDVVVEIEVEENNNAEGSMLAMGIDINMGEILGGMLPKKKKVRHIPVREARRIILQEESDKLIDMDDVITEALNKAEQDGIIFIDEIDKITVTSQGAGVDVSREGVQRDILPIVEGSTVSTKYGPIKTDFMLFIAAGAFHVAKVSDLIPELLGRFPIKVDLLPLTQEDLKRILTQPDNAVIKQYKALLKTENIELEFLDSAIEEIAKLAHEANETGDNIGARRLHTILENLLEDVSFDAVCGVGRNIIVDVDYVKTHLSESIEADLQKYIL
ncbi:MAG: ATP-dependent protease ATPase subunit HslU [Clostridia bacterium]